MWTSRFPSRFPLPQVSVPPESEKEPEDLYAVGATLKLECEDAMGSPNDIVLSAHITGTIRVGREQVSQLVLVQDIVNCVSDAGRNIVGDIDGNATIIAKFYDPAYSTK